MSLSQISLSPKVFKRREKRDISVSRITNNSISLDLSNNLESILGKRNSGKSAFKKSTVNNVNTSTNSVFVRRLLSEILPSSPKENAPSNKKWLSGIKEKKTSKKFSVTKLYEKKCDSKKHKSQEKFIMHFLSPLNKFISSEFSLYNEEYKEIVEKIPCLKKVGSYLPKIRY